MTIAFISDLHLTPERPAANQWFEQFNSSLHSHVERLYILGDLFEYWIGDDGSELLGQQVVEKSIRELSDSGVEVFFMHGNRDFLVGEAFAERTGCHILNDPCLIELDGMPVLLSHGDLLCTDDTKHQQARQTMVTSKWKKAFLNKPLGERHQEASEIRSNSEKDKQLKDMAIMDVNQQAVESMMKENGVLTLIHGHTHKPGVHNLEIDGQPATRYVLGDWYTQRSMLFYENGRFALTR